MPAAPFVRLRTMFALVAAARHSRVDLLDERAESLC
jgi:hypothetical protein